MEVAMFEPGAISRTLADAAGRTAGALPEPARRVAVRVGDLAAGEARHWANRWAGARQRLAGRVAGAVLDAQLSDRVRSELGRLERRLDIPRVHVVVERGKAYLHGDV